MTVTVMGDSIEDIRRKIGDRAPVYDIAIRFRSTNRTDTQLPGYIVDTTQITDKFGVVPREFENAEAAVEFLREVLSLNDAWVAEQNK